MTRQRSSCSGFDTTSRNSNLALVDFLSERRRHADNDLALAQAIKNSSAAVVLGYFFHMSEATLEYRLEPSEIDRRLKRLANSKYPLIIYKAQDTASLPFVRAYAPEDNLDILAESAESSGYFSLRSDADGVLRWMPLVVQAGEDLSLRGAPVFPDHRAALLALADVLVGDLSRHAAKEDGIFFPAIEAALGSSEGPTAVMRAEHRGIHACGARYRQLLAGLRLDGSVGAKASAPARGPDPESAGVTPAAAQALAENLHELGDLIGVHFEKEESILFPLAESLLPLEEQLVLGALLESNPG